MSTDPFFDLENWFKKFPGIGPRQARRFVYYLVRRPSSEVERFIHAIRAAKKTLKQCSFCQRFHFNINQPDDNLCDLCNNSKRDQTLLLIVEKESDLENIHATGAYDGRYFVLGGLAPLTNKDLPPSTLRLDKLTNLIKKTQEIKEIIFGLAANTEGDYTAVYVQNVIAPYVKSRKIKISALGRGLSTGLELEYSDAETLKNALRHREETKYAEEKTKKS